MAALDRAVECLRPLVSKSSAWDCCILWGLGDDPSRFIEWRGCCCGGNSEHIRVKEDGGKEQSLVPKCRDTNIHHPVRTEACKALAKIPLSIALYSGIHGDVVMSKQLRWLTNGNSSVSDEGIGTQVLVPVAGGLIELLSRKHVQKDQRVIDFILSRYISVEQETMLAHSFTKSNVGEPLYSPLFEDRNFTPALQLPSPISKSTSHTGLEGSSTGSNLSNAHQPLKLALGHVSSNTSPEKSSGRYPPKQNSPANLKRKQDASFSNLAADHSLKNRQRIERESYQSKNLITERNRRNRIKNGLFALRALVPNISKMDMAAILGDAIDYIKDLQKSVKKYQDELREMAEEDCKCNAEGEAPKFYRERKGRDYTTAEINDKLSQSSADEKKQSKAEIEVNQIGERDFLVKIICNHKRAGFLRLMQAMESLGLQVIDANVTTFNGSVLNILKVEAKEKEVQPKTLKDSLIELLL